jgi:hypothetical protein
MVQSISSWSSPALKINGKVGWKTAQLTSPVCPSRTYFDETLPNSTSQSLSSWQQSSVTEDFVIGLTGNSFINLEISQTRTDLSELALTNKWSTFG